jgi:SH3 domain protein
MKRFKYLMGAIAFFFLFSLPALAETRYVSEIKEITLRTGPGVQFKIAAFIRSGSPLTVMEPGEEWTQVQTSSGKEGWVLTRYIQEDLPNGVKLAQLQQKYQQTAAENTRLASENKALQQKAGTLETELATTRNTAEKLKSDYDNLRKNSAQFISLKSKYKVATDELEQTKAKADKIENELNMLYNDKRIWWFLAGVGVLLLGYIFGYSTKPQRRKPSLR